MCCVHIACRVRSPLLGGYGLRFADDVPGIRRWFSTSFKSRQELEVEKDEFYDKYNEERRIQGKEAVDRLVEEEESEKARARAKAKSA